MVLELLMFKDKQLQEEPLWLTENHISLGKSRAEYTQRVENVMEED